MNQSTKLALNFDILTEDLTINVPADFPTIQEALDSLNRTFIPPDMTVTIKVAAGVYTQTTRIIVNHTNGDRVIIEGETPKQYTVTGFSGTNASAYGIILSNTSGIAVDDVVFIPTLEMTATTGNGHPLMGAYRVLSTNSTIVNVKHNMRGAIAPIGYVTLGSNTGFYKMPTVIKCQGCSGISIAHGHVLGGIKNIAFVGDGTETDTSPQFGVTRGIDAGVRTAIYEVGHVACIEFGGYGASITGNGAFAWLDRALLCGNGKAGLYIAEGAGVAVHDHNLIANHNGGHGVNAFGIAPGCAITRIIACDNGACGINVEGSYAIVDTSIVGLNGSFGVCANYGASLHATTVASFANGSFDFCAGVNSTINASGSFGYLVSPVYSPALNTYSGIGGFIIG